MSKNIRGIFVDVYGTGVADDVTIEHSIDSFQKLLGCSCVDVPLRYVGNKLFTFICDDEGLLRSGWKPSAIMNQTGADQAALVGNLFIVGCDPDSMDVRSLTDEEVRHIFAHIIRLLLISSKGVLESWEAVKDVGIRLQKACQTAS